MPETAAERRRGKQHIQSVCAGERVGLHPKQEEVDAITFLKTVKVLNCTECLLLAFSIHCFQTVVDCG